MDSNNTALNEIVRVARLASGGNPDVMRSLAKALWAAADDMADKPDAAPITDAEESAPQSLDHIVERATKLANRMDAPHGVMLDLAASPIDVARPVLEKSSVLTQDDLIGITVHQSRDHVATIAGRWDIGPQLADALVTYGNDDVLRIMFGNANAKLGEKALITVGKRAINAVHLQPMLMQRNDLPVELMSLLMEKVLGEHRVTLLSKLIRVDPVDAAHKFQIPKKTRQSRQFIDATQLAERLARRRGIDESILVDLAIKKKQLELLLCCSKLFRIDLDLTLGILSEKTGLSLATFCRGNELNVHTFSQIFAASGTNGPQASASMLNVLQFYKRLPIPDAIDAIKIWRQRLEANQQPEEVPLSA